MIKFGPSGNGISFFEEGLKKSEDAARMCAERSLDCYEYSFGRGLNLTEKTARSIGASFANEGVELSVHAPYYINLANPDDEMAEKSYGYILGSARLARFMGAKRIVFHPAAQGKVSREEAVAKTQERMERLTELIYEQGYEDLMFCPETMGKLAQIGTVEEVTRFCQTDKVFTPCIDFGHVNARELGSLKTEQDYIDRLEYMIAGLGLDRMKAFHMHFSKIMYTDKGEKKHLTFADTEYGPEPEPCMAAVKKLGLEPYIVTESDGTQPEDAAYMKKVYLALVSEDEGPF
ncbi:MAG: TIM barrel protein [Clostridia bacterium]|nr:TIM barrel protein [Clostridia bacterium]